MNQDHLSDEQLLDAYYGELDASGHLDSCDECRSQFERLQEVLDPFNEFAIPQRGPGHGGDVWTKLLPQLPPDAPRRRWLRWWTLTPVFAALLVVAFVTGRWSERGSHIDGISEKARERVLLISLSDHLEQSQIVLANVANADPHSPDLSDERDRAHELLGANRLLRQTAVRLGDYADAQLLDELERVLLDVANSPTGRSPADMERIQGLLFRVRVTSTASRERGEKL